MQNYIQPNSPFGERPYAGFAKCSNLANMKHAYNMYGYKYGISKQHKRDLGERRNPREPLQNVG